MLDLSPTKLLIIVVVVVVLLGPKRLPEVARQLGAGWRKLREFHQQVDQELRQSLPDLPSSHDIVKFARSPVALLNQLADRDDDPPNGHEANGKLDETGGAERTGPSGATEGAGSFGVAGGSGVAEGAGVAGVAEGTGVAGVAEGTGGSALDPAGTGLEITTRPPILEAVVGLDIDDPNLN